MPFVGSIHWHQNLRYQNVGLFSDNRAELQRRQKWVKKMFAAAGRLLIVLDLRQKLARMSRLVATHVAGDMNVLGDIPPCSFGYSKQWHCTNDYEFISVINSKF